jgi:hypothetical protein
MPRLRKIRGARAFRPIWAYLSAIALAVGVMYLFDYDRQAWIFILGMVVQLIAFIILSWIRLMTARAGRK